MYRRFDYKNAASQLKCLFPSSQLPRRSHTTPFKLNSLRQEPRPPPDQGSEDMDYEPSYDELRSEANVHAKLRAENFQKAAQAHGKKQFELAQYYAQLVRVCQ